MDTACEPVQGQDMSVIPPHPEAIERRERMSVRVGGAHQTLESNRAAVGEAENGLEMAADGEPGEIPDGPIAVGRQHVLDRNERRVWRRVVATDSVYSSGFDFRSSYFGG